MANEIFSTHLVQMMLSLAVPNNQHVCVSAIFDSDQILDSLSVPHHCQPLFATSPSPVRPFCLDAILIYDSFHTYSPQHETTYARKIKIFLDADNLDDIHVLTLRCSATTLTAQPSEVLPVPTDSFPRARYLPELFSAVLLHFEPIVDLLADPQSPFSLDAQYAAQLPDPIPHRHTTLEPPSTSDIIATYGADIRPALETFNIHTVCQALSYIENLPSPILELETLTRSNNPLLSPQSTFLPPVPTTTPSPMEYVLATSLSEVESLQVPPLMQPASSIRHRVSTSPIPTDTPSHVSRIQVNLVTNDASERLSALSGLHDTSVTMPFYEALVDSVYYANDAVDDLHDLIELTQHYCAIVIRNQALDRPRRNQTLPSELRSLDNHVNVPKLFQYLSETHESYQCVSFYLGEKHICPLYEEHCLLNRMLDENASDYDYVTMALTNAYDYIYSRIPCLTAPYAYLEFIAGLQFQESVSQVLRATLMLPP